MSNTTSGSFKMQVKLKMQYDNKLYTVKRNKMLNKPLYDVQLYI